jgi:hypothetical protein
MGALLQTQVVLGSFGNGVCGVERDGLRARLPASGCGVWRHLPGRMIARASRALSGKRGYISDSVRSISFKIA